VSVSKRPAVRSIEMLPNATMRSGRRRADGGRGRTATTESLLGGGDEAPALALTTSPGDVELVMEARRVLQESAQTDMARAKDMLGESVCVCVWVLVCVCA
jgi:hypothetical protein